MRLPFNEFRPEAGVQAALDPAAVHRLTIRRDCRQADARAQPDFALEVLRIKVWPLAAGLICRGSAAAKAP